MPPSVSPGFPSSRRRRKTLGNSYWRENSKLKIINFPENFYIFLSPRRYYVERIFFIPPRPIYFQYNNNSPELFRRRNKERIRPSKNLLRRRLLLNGMREGAPPAVTFSRESSVPRENMWELLARFFRPPGPPRHIKTLPEPPGRMQTHVRAREESGGRIRRARERDNPAKG